MPTARATTQDDSTRLAENLNIFDPSIEDRDSFDEAYISYLTGTDALDNKQLMNDTFKKLRSKKSNISNERIFKKAGGKNLKQDRLTDAKVIVKSRREFIKKGAQRVDLKGFDTKKRGNRFNILAQSGKQTVFAREDTIKMRGKTINVLRDQKGRFVRRRK